MSRSLGVVFLLGLCATGISAAPGVRLETDPRMERRVTLRAPLITIRDAVAEFSSQTGVTLEAAPELQDQTVIVIEADRPAAEVVHGLAAALGCEWISRKSADGSPSYLLTQTASSRREDRERSTRYRVKAATELEEYLQAVDRYRKKFGPLERKDIQSEVERLRAQVLDLPVGVERMRAEADLSAAETASSAEAQPLLLAFASLAPEAKERLLAGERLVMALNRRGAIPMPDPVLASLRETRQFLAVRASRGFEKVVALQSDDEAIAFNTRVSFGRLVLDIVARRLPDRPTTPRITIPRLQLTSSRAQFGPPMTDTAPGTFQAERPEDSLRPVHLKWTPKTLDPEVGATYCSHVTLSDAIAAIGEPTTVTFVGDAALRALKSVPRRTEASPDLRDAFDTPEMMMNRFADKDRQGRLTVGEVLKELAERSDTDIVLKHDGVAQFRSTLGFLTRPASVDPKLVTRVFRTVAEGKPYDSGIAVEAARSLTRPQAETLSNEQLGFLWRRVRFGEPAASWAGWRLLGELSTSNREALLSGGSIAFSRMTKADRAVSLAFLDHIREPYGEPIDLELGPADLSSVTLRLSERTALGRKLDVLSSKIGYPLSTLTLWCDPDKASGS